MVDELDGIPRGLWSRAAATSRIAWRAGVSGMSRLVGGRDGADRRLGETLLKELDGLKGMAMKVGQILSYMDVGFPDSVTEQLERLQRGVSPMPWPRLQAVLDEELGERMATFARIDPDAVAAASIGQVHRAWLVDGRAVAVKVRYPGISDALEADFRQLDRLGALAGRFSAVDGRVLVQELRARVLEECDYTQEAENQRRFAGFFATDDQIRVPAVVSGLSTDAVLTTEWCDGEDFRRFATSAGPTERATAAAALFRLNMEPLLRHGWLHADPHPGNQRYRPDGSIVALDFGCVRHFEPDFVSRFVAFVRAVHEDDEAAFRQLAGALGLAPRPDKTDWDEMRALYGWLFGPIAQPWHFSREWWAEGRRFTGASSPNARHQGMPPEWIWILRVVWGCFALLVHLDAECDLSIGWRHWTDRRNDPAGNMRGGDDAESVHRR